MSGVELLGGRMVENLGGMKREFLRTMKKFALDKEIQTVENQMTMEQLDKFACGGGSGDGSGSGSGSEDAGVDEEDLRHIMLAKFSGVQSNQITDHWSVCEEVVIVGLLSEILNDHGAGGEAESEAEAEAEGGGDFGCTRGVGPRQFLREFLSGGGGL